MRTLVRPQRLQVHTVFCWSLSQLLRHLCVRTRQMSPGFMGVHHPWKARIRGRTSGCKRSESGVHVDARESAGSAADCQRCERDKRSTRNPPSWSCLTRSGHFGTLVKCRGRCALGCCPAQPGCARYGRGCSQLATRRRSLATVSTVEQSPGDIRSLSRLSWIMVVGGICLLGLAVIASMLRLVPDLVSTVAAILSAASMFSGLVIGVLIVLQRSRDE